MRELGFHAASQSVLGEGQGQEQRREDAAVQALAVICTHDKVVLPVLATKAPRTWAGGAHRTGTPGLRVLATALAGPALCGEHPSLAGALLACPVL